MNDDLIERYVTGTATEAERREVEAWFEARGEALPDPYGDDPALMQAAQERTLKLLLDRIHQEPARVVPLRRRWYRYAVAAAILLLCGTGAIFWLHNRHQPAAVQLVKNDIAPGHNQATLTLANGQQIILKKGLSGQLATQGKTIISATGNDIAYNSNAKEESVSYNSLTTGRREQSPYPLVLADGTKVWLNAQSKLTFPTAFNGKERIVQLTGEAYFEVAHNARQPFKVQTEKQTIEDIGTSFDVNAYTDEPATTTTLVAGSVKIGQTFLKPGQQFNGTKISEVNTAQYIAWKNGDFDFRGDDIRTVMRQLARWYDIDVVYQGNMNGKVAYAGISRSKNISAVLRLLEATKGVHFQIEGRRVTVIE